MRVKTNTLLKISLTNKTMNKSVFLLLQVHMNQTQGPSLTPAEVFGPKYLFTYFHFYNGVESFEM